jgi:putative addiction module component (TIGR02574 family)
MLFEIQSKSFSLEKTNWTMKMGKGARHMSKLMPEILKLSVEERLALADEIYASFAPQVTRSDDDWEDVTPEQAAELERRFAEYDANPSIGIPVEQTLAKMKRRK